MRSFLNFQGTIKILAEDTFAEGSDVPQRNGGDPGRDRTGRVPEDHGPAVQAAR